MRLLLKTALLISLATLAMPGWAECIEGDCVNGYGVKDWSAGDRYLGDFVDSEMQGKGIYAYAGGNRYKGEFHRNQKHGKGIFTFASGDRYEGDFVNDKMQGKGIFTWASGQYKGDRYE